MFDIDMCLTRQARSGLTRGSHQKIVYCNFSTKRQWRSHHLTPQKRPNLTVLHMVQESCSSSSEAAGPFLSPPLCLALQRADSADQLSPSTAAGGHLPPRLTQPSRPEMSGGPPFWIILGRKQTISSQGAEPTSAGSRIPEWQERSTRI